MEDKQFCNPIMPILQRKIEFWHFWIIVENLETRVPLWQHCCNKSWALRCSFYEKKFLNWGFSRTRNPVAGNCFHQTLPTSSVQIYSNSRDSPGFCATKYACIGLLSAICMHEISCLETQKRKLLHSRSGHAPTHLHTGTYTRSHRQTYIRERYAVYSTRFIVMFSPTYGIYNSCLICHTTISRWISVFLDISRFILKTAPPCTCLFECLFIIICSRWKKINRLFRMLLLTFTSVLCENVQTYVCFRKSTTTYFRRQNTFLLCVIFVRINI